MTESVSDMKPVKPEAGRRFWPLLRYGMGGVILFALGGMTVISLKQVQALSVEVSQLKAALQESPDFAPFQTQLTALQQQTTLLQKQHQNLADKPALAALQQRTEVLEKQLREQVNSVATLNSTLSSFQKQLHTVSQRPVSPSATVQTTAKPGTPARKKSTLKARTQRQVTAPFVLTGIERRGGIAFAAVAPQQAANLADVFLMEPGETRQGWTLVSVSGQQAQFRVAGQTRTLAVK